MATQINETNFQEIISSDKPALVDFWAEWCGPCKRISPIIDELYNEYNEKAHICKCDVDTNNAIAVEYGIRNIPTILFFKGGKVVEKVVGATSKEALAEKIEGLL